MALKYFQDLLGGGVNQQTTGSTSQLDRFMQALGAERMGTGSRANQMQDMAQARHIQEPNMMNAVMGMQQPQQQPMNLPTTQLNPLLAMLMSGGR